MSFQRVVVRFLGFSGPAKYWPKLTLNLFLDFYFILIWFPFFNISAPASACPEGWAHKEESCYLVIDIPTLNWSHARRTCQNLGGDLAIIRSEDENNFIFDLVKQQETVQFFGAWLGLHRNASDNNQFYWVDGTPLAGQYSAWTPGTPNHPNERCGVMYDPRNRQGTWDDQGCDWQKIHLDRVPVVLCKKKSNWDRHIFQSCLQTAQYIEIAFKKLWFIRLTNDVLAYIASKTVKTEKIKVVYG